MHPIGLCLRFSYDTAPFNKISWFFRNWYFYRKDERLFPVHYFLVRFCIINKNFRILHKWPTPVQPGQERLVSRWMTFICSGWIYPRGFLPSSKSTFGLWEGHGLQSVFFLLLSLTYAIWVGFNLNHLDVYAILEWANWYEIARCCYYTGPTHNCLKLEDCN